MKEVVFIQKISRTKVQASNIVYFNTENLALFNFPRNYFIAMEIIINNNIIINLLLFATLTIARLLQNEQQTN